MNFRTLFLLVAFTNDILSDLSCKWQSMEFSQKHLLPECHSIGGSLYVHCSKNAILEKREKCIRSDHKEKKVIEVGLFIEHSVRRKLVLLFLTIDSNNYKSFHVEGEHDLGEEFVLNHYHFDETYIEAKLKTPLTPQWNGSHFICFIKWENEPDNQAYLSNATLSISETNCSSSTTQQNNPTPSLTSRTYLKEISTITNKEETSLSNNNGPLFFPKI